jgi:hypothetical protein
MESWENDGLLEPLKCGPWKLPSDPAIFDKSNKDLFSTGVYFPAN